jgi:hypothetical protein
MVQSELKYIIGATIENLKCKVFGGKISPFRTVRVCWVVRHGAMVKILLGPDLEPSWVFGPVANTTPAETRIFSLAGERDSFQGGSSGACTIHCQNSTPTSSLNTSGVEDITQLATSCLSATQQRSMITSSVMLGTSIRSTPAPRGTSQAYSTRRVISCHTSGIAGTPIPLSGLVNLPSPIPNPEAHATITNPLPTQATERPQRQRQWELQSQEVSTP